MADILERARAALQDWRHCQAHNTTPPYPAALLAGLVVELETARAQLEQAPPRIVTCPDMERTAELYNNGYQEAMQHKTGGAEHRDWLIQAAEQKIGDLVEDDPADAYLYLQRVLVPVLAANIADVLLSEIDFGEGDSDD